MPPADSPAWGGGGPAATAAVLGRLQASLLDASAWAMRCQRRWRLSQVPKWLQRRATRERAAMALQRYALSLVWVRRGSEACFSNVLALTPTPTP